MSPRTIAQIVHRDAPTIREDLQIGLAVERLIESRFAYGTTERVDADPLEKSS